MPVSLFSIAFYCPGYLTAEFRLDNKVIINILKMLIGLTAFDHGRVHSKDTFNRSADL